jgi:predicted O-methyltransferase YrrM
LYLVAAVRLGPLHDFNIPGMFKHDEMRLLYRTVKSAEGPGDIAEIGSWKGRTTVVMGLALKDAGVEDCRIHAVDHHQGGPELEDRVAKEGSSLDAFRRNVRDSGVANRIEEMVLESDEAARILTERGVRLRLLFIDGAHDEESVRQDIRNWVGLVRPGGIIAFHDCEPDGEYPGVWKAFQSELASRVEIVDRASSLLVTKLRS